ncbi:PKD domain-containing protein, partial [Chloroflexota bacterium]
MRKIGYRGASIVLVVALLLLMIPPLTALAVAPDIRVEPASIEVSLPPDATKTITEGLAIYNDSATAILEWSLSESPAAAWLSEVPNDGAFPAGAYLTPGTSIPVSLTFDTTGLTAGTDYTTDLVITGSNFGEAEETTINVGVTLHVSRVVPHSLELIYYPDTSNTMWAPTISSGADNLTWSLSESPAAAWLSEAPTSGEVTGGTITKGAGANITLNAGDTLVFTAGDTITFTAGDTVLHNGAKKPVVGAGTLVLAAGDVVIFTAGDTVEFTAGDTVKQWFTPALTFDTTGLTVGNDYTTDLVFTTDDPDEPTVTLGIILHIRTTEVVMPSLDVGPGDTFTIDVTVVNIPSAGTPLQGLGAYDFTLSWNTSIITMLSEEGGNAPFASIPTAGPGTWKTDGTVYFNNAQTAMLPGPSGNITVARFEATAVGSVSETSPLSISVTSMVDTNSVAIPRTTVDGSVLIVTAPTAAFYTDDADWTVDAGQVIQFSDNSTGGPASWKWDFSYNAGDGFQVDSTLQNPTHTYTVPGTYKVALEVTNSAGTDDTIADANYDILVETGPLDSVVVAPPAPTLAIGALQTFTATGSDAYANEITGLTWTWAVVAGGGTIDAGTGEFTAGTTAGTFTDTIEATATDGATVSGYASVTIDPDPLDTVVVDPSPHSTTIGTSQVFTAIGSDAYANEITGLTWTWAVVAGGGTIDAGTGEFTAGTTAGTFTDTIEATATFGATVSGYSTVTIEPDPLDTVVVTPNPGRVQVLTSATFTATGSDAYANEISGLSWTWDVVNGGGTIDAGTGEFTAGAVVGTYTDTVEATATYGATVSGYATVEVITTAIDLAPTSGPKGKTVSVTGAGFEASETGIAVTW